MSQDVVTNIRVLENGILEHDFLVMDDDIAWDCCKNILSWLKIVAIGSGRVILYDGELSKENSTYVVSFTKVQPLGELPELYQTYTVTEFNEVERVIRFKVGTKRRIGNYPLKESIASIQVLEKGTEYFVRFVSQNFELVNVYRSWMIKTIPFCCVGFFIGQTIVNATLAEAYGLTMALQDHFSNAEKIAQESKRSDEVQSDKGS